MRPDPRVAKFGRTPPPPAAPAACCSLGVFQGGRLLREARGRCDPDLPARTGRWNRHRVAGLSVSAPPSRAPRSISRHSGPCDGPPLVTPVLGNPIGEAPKLFRASGLHRLRRRPTLPHGLPCSTMGSGGLNFRVRDGNGCGPSDIATGNLAGCRDAVGVSSAGRIRTEFNLFALLPAKCLTLQSPSRIVTARSLRYKQADRAISTGQLRALTALPLPAYRRRSLRRLFKGCPRET